MLVPGMARREERGWRGGAPRGQALRRMARRARRVTAALLGPVVAAGTALVPVAVTAAVAAVAVAKAAPAQASTGASVLILSSSVNGGTASAEYKAAVADGLNPTLELASSWDGLATSDFQKYAALIIGDPSATTCSSAPVADAVSSAGAWGPAVTGNVSVAGTAPAFAGTAGTALLQDAIGYAASSPSGTTGLYVSLNCDYSGSAVNDADAGLLDHVEGGGFAVTGHVSGSGPACADSGSVNTQGAEASGSFASLTGSALLASLWGSACPVQESFNSWPANFTPVAFDAAAPTADFTSSSGTSGQPYVLAGTPFQASQPGSEIQSDPLTGTSGGAVPAGTTSGGSGAGSATQAAVGSSAAPVNTETGAFSSNHTDVSVPGFGPGLDFTRTYDSQAAQAAEQTAAPGPMGYGWTDTWATSARPYVPVTGDIYALDGLAGAANTGDGLAGYAANGQAPGSAPLGQPGGVLYSGGNVFYADSQGNRVIEVPGSTGTQFGVSMTAGKAYVIAGSYTGQLGMWKDLNGPGTQQLLDSPAGLAMDSAGDLFIANMLGQQVDKLTPAGNLSAVAGTGTAGLGADGGSATSSQLHNPVAVAVDSSGNVYVADSYNNRVQEVPAAGGSQWGQSMIAGDIYTVAGSASGTSGRSANGTAGGNSLLNNPQGITIDGSGAMYIADAGNNRVIEIPKSAGSSWGYSMNAGDVYDVAGSAAGTAGHTGDGSSAYNTALLAGPQSVTLDSSGNLVIADTANNRVQFVPKSSGTNWGQPMTAGDMYTIAGSAAGTAGNSGNGGPGGSALLAGPAFAATFSSGKLWITDTANNTVRYVDSSTDTMTGYAGNGQNLASAGEGGPAINGQLQVPSGEVADSHGDLYISDSQNNRVEEIAAYGHTQWGIGMTGGDVYTIAGSKTGVGGNSGDGGLATSALLADPQGLAVDSAGNLYIADFGNQQVREVSAATGNISTIAGSVAATAGSSGDGGPAASALLNHPEGLAIDKYGDLFIADKDNNRIQEVQASGGESFGQTMTAGDIYTVAGSSAGTGGNSGNGGAATAAKLSGPLGVAVDGSGDLLIADTANEQVRIVALASGKLWGQQRTAGDIYTLAGSTAGTAGYAGDGGPASGSQLYTPDDLTTDPAGNLYIADGHNDVVREIAAANGDQWGTVMEQNDIYTIAGQPGSSTSAGDGGPGAMATILFTVSSKTDSYGDLYIGDQSGGQLREIPSATPATIAPPPGATYPSALYPPPGSTINGTAYAGGITITQPGGAQITFWTPPTGGCVLPQVTAGGYCVDAQFGGAALTANGTSSWTFTLLPGSDSYTYSQLTGQLTTVTSPAGDTLTVSYNSPAPGQATAGTSTPITCPATATSCETIKAADGRALVLGSDSTGQVTSVTDPLGRQWTYAYTGCTGTGSDVCGLASATDPMGNKTTYTYDTTNASPILAADLLTVTAPNAQPGGPDAGDASVNTYDSYGRVTTQTDPMGNKTTLNYCVSAATGNCLNTATGTGLVTVTDSATNKTLYGYQKGTQVSQADLTAGTALTSQTDAVPDLTVAATQNQSAACPGNTNGSLADIASFDGLGNQTANCNNSYLDTTSTTQPSPAGGTATTTSSYTTTGLVEQGNCTSTAEATATCSSNPGPGPVAPGGTITPPSAPPSGLTWTQYDTNGDRLYTSTGMYSPSGTLTAIRTSYQLFKGNTVTLNGNTISCAAVPPSPSLPCATIDPDGVVSQLAYNAQGDLASTSTPDGNSGGEFATTSWTYDSDGEPLTVVEPDGNLSGANAGNYTTATAWNSDGQQTSVTQGGGTGYTDTPRTTNYGYDANGNQTTVKDARGYTTTTTYNADDQATLVKDPDGNQALTCYDGYGHVAQTVPAAGVAASNLTPASCPTSYPAGYSTRLAPDATVSTFNADGQVTQQTTPAPAGQTGWETTGFTYDGDGNMLTTTAPPTANGGQNNVTVDTYNSAGQLTSDTTGYGTPAASTVSYCYDSNGDTTSAVYANGNTGGTAACSGSSPWTVTASPQATYQTTYSYDSVGNLVSTTAPATAAAPGGATTTATYDAAGNRLTLTDQGGVTATWTYTPNGNTSGVSFSGSSAHSASYGYDANGNLTSITDATGSSSFGYDPFDELTTAQNGAGQVTSYGYTPDGDTASITYPLPATATWATSDTVSYGYDNAGNLNSVTDFNGHQLAITDTADGLPGSVTLGSSGDTVTTSYDNTDTPSLITLKNGSIALQSFSYADSPGRTLLSETDTPTSSLSPAVYTYDSKGRVTSMTPGTSATKNYGFDASGNLTTLPGGATGSYDHAGELTSATQGSTTTSYAYNADGDRLTATQGSSTLTSGTWNGAGQLTSYTSPAGALTSPAYTGTGLRATATFTPSGGHATTQNYVWNTTTPTPSLLMDSANAYIYGPSTTPAEQVNLSTGTISYLIADSLGSVRGTVNSGGAVTGNTSYDAWGNPQSTGGLTSSTPFGYAGGYTDPTGLIYLINRYYDPATGQFTSLDPAVSQTLEPYSYAADDPITATDPSGMCPIPGGCSGIHQPGAPAHRYQPVYHTNGPSTWNSPAPPPLPHPHHTDRGPGVPNFGCSGAMWRLGTCAWMLREINNAVRAECRGPRGDICNQWMIMMVLPPNPDDALAFEGELAASGFTKEELAQLIYQHVGEGDIEGKPTLGEIERSLFRGSPQRLEQRNAYRFDYGGVRVTVNFRRILRSTAFYRK